MTELYLVPQVPQDNDPFAHVRNQADVDAEFARMFDLDLNVDAVIIEELGADAIAAAQADGLTYGEAMNARAAAAGVTELTVDNVEDEVNALYAAFDAGKERAERVQREQAAINQQQDELAARRALRAAREEEDDESLSATA